MKITQIFSLLFVSAISFANVHGSKKIEDQGKANKIALKARMRTKENNNIVSGWKKRKKITPEDRIKIKEYFDSGQNEGKTYDQIKAHFGISRITLIRILKDMNINHILNVKDSDVRNYIAKNPDDTYRTISKKFQTKQNNIVYKIKKLNIPYKSKKARLNPEKLAQAIFDNPDLTQKELAGQLGVTACCVTANIKKHSIDYYDRKNDFDYENRNKIKTVVKINLDDFNEYVKSNPNKNQYELAPHFKVSVSTLNKFIAKNETVYEKRYPVAKEIDQHKLLDIIESSTKITRAQLADQFGITPKYMGKILQKLQIDLPNSVVEGRKNAKNITKEALIQYKEENPYSNQKDISDHFGVSQGTIADKYKKFQIEN